MSDPRISVVVPTHQRPELLERCLDALDHQIEVAGEYEVVVVDDASHDATDAVLERPRQMPLTVLHHEHNRGPAAARNTGLHAATADLVLFLDDDVGASPTLVRDHLAFHQQQAEPSTGLLGRIAWAPDLRVTPFMEWLDRSGLQFAYDTWLTEGSVQPPAAAFYTANLSLSRALVLDAGGFDERFPHPAYEDMELAWRLGRRGFRLEYRPAVLAYHARGMDIEGFAERMGRVARSAGIMLELQPDFPIDHSSAEAGITSERKLALLRLLGPIAERTGWKSLRDRYYAAVIAHAYRSARLEAGAGAGKRA